MMGMRKWACGVMLLCSVLLVLFVVPSWAEACAVCGAVQTESTRKAFVGTTAFMTFLPIGMLFLVVGWYIRRTLEKEEQEGRFGDR